MSAVAPVNLHFEDSGNWYSLPEWAESFISVGRQLAIADRGTSRIVTAIVVPTRAFGAAFVTLGMVVGDAATHERTCNTAHFEMLFDLPPGTPVIYRKSANRTYKGLLQGPDEHNDKLYVRVQVNSDKGGGTTYLVGESGALNVQPAHHSGKLPKNQSGKNTRFANSFVESLLGVADPVQLGNRSSNCCAIIGKRNALEYEIRRTPLALHANGHQAKGHLQDVLRVDRFVADGQSHRSVLVPIGTKRPSAELIENVERGVVFDGARAFLMWGDAWQGRHQVVILDRTDAYFDDAINAVNARFSQSRAETESELPRCDVPAGGELLTFREALV
jgi:hypothetical protein